jgi:hypothetical protein
MKAKRRSCAPWSGSAFLNWFYAQAGKPIMNEVQYLKLRHETIPSLRRKLAEAESNLAEMDRYHTAQQYALYAWTSRPNTEAQAPE